MKQITIYQEPAGRINPELAQVLVGLTIHIRPELLLWTTEPTDQTQGDFYYVHNDDLREVLTVRDGIAAASNWFAHLPLGRVTSIERRACTLDAAAILLATRA